LEHLHQALIILKYLAEHKCSTCEEIAQFEYDNNTSSKRRLKSITDDIRKFVNHNLIPSQLVLLDQPKKKYNKQVKTYCLSPVGILYCLYLFGHFRIPDESDFTFFDMSELESDFLRNISKEYSSMLPKVFGRFENFEKIFGEQFLSVVTDSILAIYNIEFEGIPAEEFILPNYVLSTFDFISGGKFRGPQQLIAEQMSLIFYIHLEDSIKRYLWSKEGDLDFEKTRNMSPEEANQYYKEKNKTSTDRYREELKDAKELWTKLMNEDKKIKKWYVDFLKDVAIVKKSEAYAISEYKNTCFA